MTERSTSDQSCVSRPRRRTARFVGLLVTLIVVAGVSWWTYVGYCLKQAEQQIAAGQESAAMNWIQRGHRLSPNHPRGLLLEARLARRRLDQETFEEKCNAADAAGASPRDVENERLLAEAAWGELKKAEEQSGELFASFTDARDATQAMVRGYERVRQPQKAVPLITGWLREYPRDPNAFYWQARLEIVGERWADAEKDCHLALKLDPSHDRAAFQLGVLLTRAKRYAEALDYLPRGQLLDASRTQSLLLQTECYLRLRAWNSAEKTLGHIDEQRASQADAMLLAARLSAGRERYAEALARLDKLPATCRGYLDYLELRTECLQQLRSPEAAEARRQFERGRRQLQATIVLSSNINFDDRNIEGRFQVGSELLRLGRVAEARQWLESVVYLDPSHTAARQMLSQP